MAATLLCCVLDIKTNEMSQQNQCPEFPHFGARYPDARCIDGFLWDLDSCDEIDGQTCFTHGGDDPCPFCNTEKYLEFMGAGEEEGPTKEQVLQQIEFLRKRYGNESADHTIGMDKNEIPILDADAEDFKEQLAFSLWSTQSNSDYSNDRDRPYNGQSWTYDGDRGKHQVSGLTMRDIKDCLIKAMLLASASDKYLQADTFIKCWDYSTEPAKPTQFLLDRQNEPDFVHTKVELGTWRPQDVYNIDWSKIDPIAICQNLTVEIEKMMGIFPNIFKEPTQ
jgi:hypothetical protein